MTREQFDEKTNPFERKHKALKIRLVRVYETTIHATGFLLMAKMKGGIA